MKTVFIFLFTLIVWSTQAQIKLDPSYNYLKDGKSISYNKGLKLLQSGEYVADIDDSKRQVVIKETPSLESGEPFPFQKMVDLEGNSITPQMLNDKVIVINYWFTACRPCAQEIPELNLVVEQFKDEDVVFLAFANDIPPMVTNFVEKRPFDYTIIPGQMTNTLSLGITIFPTHIIVNKEGLITARFSGYSEGVGDKITKEINKNL